MKNSHHRRLSDKRHPVGISLATEPPRLRLILAALAAVLLTPSGFAADEVPQAGRPADFSGLVGSFQMEVSLDRSTLTLPDLATLRLSIRGAGDLTTLLPPDPLARGTSGADWEMVGPPTVTQAERSAEIVWRLRPRREGPMKIPPITLVTYHPERRAFETQVTRSIPVTVAPAGSGPATPMATTAPTGEAAGGTGDAESPASAAHFGDRWILPVALGGGLLAVAAGLLAFGRWLGRHQQPSVVAAGTAAITRKGSTVRATDRRVPAGTDRLGEQHHRFVAALGLSAGDADTPTVAQRLRTAGARAHDLADWEAMMALVDRHRFARPAPSEIPSDPTADPPQAPPTSVADLEDRLLAVQRQLLVSVTATE